MTAKKTIDKKAELSTEDKKAKDVEAKDLESKTTELSTYKIAEGSSITSKRGTLSPGVVISPDDLSGGQAAFDNLVNLKKIV